MPIRVTFYTYVQALSSALDLIAHRNKNRKRQNKRSAHFDHVPRTLRIVKKVGKIKTACNCNAIFEDKEFHVFNEGLKKQQLVVLRLWFRISYEN